MPKLFLKVLSIVLIVAFHAQPGHAGSEKRNFTLVIDAGHGGHDAGAVGTWSKEKNINLTVALAFGQLVENNCPDVQVVYTRRTDVFVPLQRRADIANNCKADLFVSVHTNALPNGRIAYGSETYSLGMARAGENLEVAKRENSVITLENDYQRTYEGFDPGKAESYVIFEIMQDRYMKQSVDLARCIQRQYKQAGRADKGVHQAGFLVLRKTSMPAVLTELGFISTPAEETYLNSKRGVEELSRSIYNGFLAYRRLHDKKASDIPADLPQLPVTAPAAAEAQTGAQGKQAEVVPVQPKQTFTAPAVTDAPEAADKKAENSESSANRKNAAAQKGNAQTDAKKSAAASDKPSAKPAGEKSAPKAQPAAKAQNAAKAQDTPKSQAATKAKTADKAKQKSEPKIVFRVQLGAGRREISETDPQFKGLKVTRRKEGTLYKYLYGSYATHAEAQKALTEVKAKIPAAYIVAYKDGEQISVAEARAAAKQPAKTKN